MQNRLFGSWDRTIATVSILASLLAIGVSVLLYLQPEDLPAYIVVRDIFLLCSLVSVIFILSIKYLKSVSTVSYQIALIRREYFVSRSLIRHLLDELSRDYLLVNLRSEDIRENHRAAESDQELFSRAATNILDDTKSSLVDYFKSVGYEIGDDIHVSLRLVLTRDDAASTLPKSLLDLLGDRIWITTVLRDSYTIKNRKDMELATVIYSISGNTAYHFVINLGNRYFACDDLRSLSDYMDENTRWRSHYNSLIVVPIRHLAENANDYNYTYSGVLSVDSLNKEHFRLYEREELVDILERSSDLISILLLWIKVRQI